MSNSNGSSNNKEYENSMGWIYQIVNDVVIVCDSQRYFIKTISKEELQNLINIKAVKLL